MSTAKVIDFLVKHVESIEQLEVLLLLREHKEREWTAAKVNEVIRSSESSISKHLEKWLSVGLLQKKDQSGGLYSYSSPSAEIDSTVDKLAEFYRDRRLTVIEYIYSKSIREIRNFSDAFKVKKDD